MKIAGFNFTKILAEKNNSNFEGLKIDSGINLESIEKINSKEIKSSDSFLIIKWSCEINYAPNIANISFSGNLVLSLEEKKAKEIISSWENKKLDQEFNMNVLNLILKKVNIKAVQLEDELNLPLHFKLPSLKSK